MSEMIDRFEQEALLIEVSDEALEAAAGPMGGEPGGCSLWSSFEPCGCTCVTG